MTAINLGPFSMGRTGTVSHTVGEPVPVVPIEKLREAAVRFSLM